MNDTFFDKIAIDAEIKYLNAKSKPLEYTLIEIDFNMEKRFIIKVHYKYGGEKRYYLVDKNFSCIEFEIDYFEEFYQCDNCNKWLNISHTNNVTKANDTFEIVKVCPHCFDELTSEYRKSKYYRNFIAEYNKNLKDYCAKGMYENGWDIIEVCIDNEKRIIKRSSVFIRGELEYGYLLLKKDNYSEMLFVCNKCGDFVRPSDSRKYKPNVMLCYKCKEKIRPSKDSEIVFRKTRTRRDKLLVPDTIIGNMRIDNNSYIRAEVSKQLGHKCFLSGYRESEMDHFIALSTIFIH